MPGDFTMKRSNWDALKLADYTSHFKLIRSNEGEEWVLTYGKGSLVDVSILSGIIQMDEVLRCLVQRTECLEQKKGALLKTDRSGEESNKLEKYDM
ncbi:hypothetical protein N7450_001504 [Penicillium hetheringtonii]|uniref:Uncharacterized protein n=1 Tax=Penicillium hetheringtonii TaxID=911720 RepID=A0AAD6H0D9_9EURO|nr:hypothetical protein N7450_001504 [Penicillium hetheringtonii]